MNRQLMEAMLSALLSIKAEGPRTERVGICGNMWELLAEGRYEEEDCEEAEDSLSDYIKDWPESTGCSAYPVPAPVGFPCRGTDAETARGAFYEIKPMWSGEYGSSRIRLLNYLIRQLTAELAGMPKPFKLPTSKRLDTRAYRDGIMLIELLDLKDRVAAGRAIKGICSYVGDSAALLELFHMWPEFSGRTNYPVRDSQYPGQELTAYHRPGRQLWSGEYGSARIRLLNFCIRTLEARQCAE